MLGELSLLFVAHVDGLCIWIYMGVELSLLFWTLVLVGWLCMNIHIHVG